MAAKSKSTHRKPLVGIIMGSTSDWETMSHAAHTLDALAIPHETRVVSAHRTPDLLFAYAAEAEKRGIEVIIAGAGGAAHLPGMAASKTVLPVYGVPVESKTLKGLDSLLSIAQMPGGVPVGTLAIGKAGAINAALLAAATLGNKYPKIREGLRKFRASQTKKVLAVRDPAKLDVANFRSNAAGRLSTRNSSKRGVPKRKKRKSK
jgi:5-(carboxyamino)imidazole ribonucleotide mutase